MPNLVVTKGIVYHNGKNYRKGETIYNVDDKATKEFVTADVAVIVKEPTKQTPKAEN